MATCTHPEDRHTRPIIDDDPEVAYCLGCHNRVRQVDGTWVAEDTTILINGVPHDRAGRML